MKVFLKLYIDESDGTSFFISAPTCNPNEYLSFDWTTKGHRILLQKLTATNVPAPEGRKPDAEWDTLVIKEGRLLEKQHNVWYDFGKNDLVDGENWEQTNEWPLKKEVAKEMLKLADEITKHQNDLDKAYEQIDDLERLIVGEAASLVVPLALDDIRRDKKKFAGIGIIKLSFSIWLAITIAILSRAGLLGLFAQTGIPLSAYTDCRAETLGTTSIPIVLCNKLAYGDNSMIFNTLFWSVLFYSLFWFGAYLKRRIKHIQPKTLPSQLAHPRNR